MMVRGESCPCLALSAMCSVDRRSDLKGVPAISPSLGKDMVEVLGVFRYDYPITSTTGSHLLPQLWVSLSPQTMVRMVRGRNALSSP